jgi:hypothetical protein
MSSLNFEKSRQDLDMAGPSLSVALPESRDCEAWSGINTTLQMIHFLFSVTSHSLFTYQNTPWSEVMIYFCALVLNIKA